MKNIIYNIGYFIREAKTIFKLSTWSNILSLFSIGLILFILSLVISGWWVSTEIITMIHGEAEVNIYTKENIDETKRNQVIEKIKDIEGILETRIIEKDEAYRRMVDILGEDARVLEYFDDNPFSTFIEAKIDIEKTVSIYKELKLIPDIEYIRDNKEVLEHLRNITKVLYIIGTLFITAVGISTVVIISHIIRQGIYNNRDEINTLRLLGASEFFISLPFLMVGLVLTIGGGILASIFLSLILINIYSQMTAPIPFLPLPPLRLMVQSLISIIVAISVALGTIGSLIGIRFD
ncbi:MAG: hypothetical protein GX308_02980 [Epulopiscium sp.]|nr:hypothetical protein [Candidatus Epulonipiscium sp.]